MRRSQNKQRGLEGERRTIKYLEQFGEVEKVVYPWSNPDIVWRPKNRLAHYAVEVKSTLGITEGKAGRIWITKSQWKEVKKYANENNLLPCMIIELLGGRTKGYWMISADAIEKKMRKSASFTVWQIVNVHGVRID